ncbi:MAG: LamG-like jellyroll fold domain-containing protein, partial [Methylobacter sp.]
QSNGALRIGGNSLWNEYFDGYIDEVRIYNRALTATQVSNNMTTPVSAANTPLQFIMGDMNMEPWIAYQPMGRAQAYQVTATKSASITEVQVYLDASATTAKKVVAGIYTDSNGHAKTLLAQGTLNTLKPGAWNAVTIPTASVTSGQKYWIAILGVDGQIGFLDQVGSGVGLMEKSSSSTLISLPASWTASSYEYKTNASMSTYGNGR